MASSYQIFTDATADLTPDLFRDLQVSVIPMDYTIDGATYSFFPSSPDFNISEFYGLLRDEKNCTTSQINAAVYISYFKPCLESGSDILYLCFSSALSGTYQSALIAADDLKPLFPDRRIAVIDTRSAGLGEGLLVWYAVQKQREGLDFDALVAYMEKMIPHLCHLFTVDDLNHLKRGGRISSATALVGGMLGIKPVLHICADGRIESMAKIRGRKASLLFLVEQMEQQAIDPQTQMVFIGHADALADAEFVAQAVRERMHPTDIHIGPIGPVIGSHTGPGAIVLLFLGRER